MRARSALLASSVLSVLLGAVAAPLSAQIVFDSPVAFDGGDALLRVLVGDVNEDGFPDLTTSHLAIFGSLPTVSYGAPGGQFGSAQILPGLAGGDELWGQADFDADGHLDLLAFLGESPQTSVSIMLGHGDGTYDPPTGINGNFSRPIDAALGDFDADGALDVAIYNGEFQFLSGSVLAVFGNGDGSFGEPIDITPDSFPFGSLGVVRAGDIDGDGFDDVVLTTPVGMPKLLSNGDGSFTELPCCGGNTPDKDFELADMNGDGREDLVDCRRIVLADPSGQLAGPSFVLGTSMTPRTVEVADLDADGELDVIVGRNWGSNDSSSDPVGDVRVYRGNGDGTAQLPGLTVSHVHKPRDIAIADVDLDGRPDAVVAENQIAPSSVRVLFNRTYGAGSPFLDLGGALEGSNGSPIQLASGTLVAGQPFAFKLASGPPNGAAYHVVGFNHVDAPFKGGVMIPSVNLINGPFGLDAAGQRTLAGNWPSGGSGLGLYMQFWMPNGSGPMGFVASSGVRAQIP